MATTEGLFVTDATTNTPDPLLASFDCLYK